MNNKKRKYTVDNPPRVYEVAQAVKLYSPDTISLLKMWGFAGRSASSRVPLTMALDFINYINTKGRGAVDAEYNAWVSSWCM